MPSLPPANMVPVKNVKLNNTMEIDSSPAQNAGASKEIRRVHSCCISPPGNGVGPWSVAPWAEHKRVCFGPGSETEKSGQRVLEVYVQVEHI